MFNSIIQGRLPKNNCLTDQKFFPLSLTHKMSEQSCPAFVIFYYNGEKIYNNTSHVIILCALKVRC